MVDILKGPMKGQWSRVGIWPHQGIVVPLFSLHSEVSCGIGEIPDLIPLMHLCKRAKMDLIQFLPINDSGFDPSPYATISSFALNPVYLGLSSLPFVKKEEIPDESTRTRWVDWNRVASIKHRWIRTYIEKHKEQFLNEPKFTDFVANSPWLEPYAQFKALYEESGYLPWWSWKKMKPNKALVQEAMIVQFLLHKQMSRVRQEADKLGILLFGDLPIFVSKNSADGWANPEIFNFLLEAGAPPDMFNKEGQKWGFPPYNWEEIEKEKWLHWRWRLESAARYYHIFRLDHLVGFFRTYCSPVSGGEGFFVPHEKESWQRLGHQILSNLISMTPMLPIGEDLGVVPEEVRMEMHRLTIPGTKVMRWERHWRGDHSYIRPEHYDPLSITCVSTHDTTLLPLWWKEHREESHLFASSLGLKWQPDLDLETHLEVLKHSHATASLFHANLLNEYLALFPDLVHPGLRDERINTPGVVSPKNWSLRFKPTVEEMGEDKRLIEALKEVCPDRPKLS